MQNPDPRVDRSRGAVYQAEDSIASVMRRAHRAVRVGTSVVTLPEEVRFGSLEAIQGFVDGVLADATTSGTFADRGPVVIQARRGFRMATYTPGRINIPAADPRGRWSLTRSVVLHEVAHHLTGAPGHGSAFRSTLVTLYARHVGQGAAELLAHLFAPIDAVPELVEAGPDEQVRRVAALLAKAESTASADEAEAYLAKAALVAQRHSVDMAVAAMAPDAHRDDPTHRMLTIGEPRRSLNKLLVSLMVATARAWSVRVDIGHGSTYVLVYGMPADLNRVEAVFATASAMMLTRATDHVRSAQWRGTTYRPPEGGPARPVTASVARNAFCLGFIDRLGRNLDEAARRARAGAGAGARAGAGADSATVPGAPPGAGPSPHRVDLALRARDLAVTDYHRATTRARGTWRGSASGAGTAAQSRRAGERAADEFGRAGLPGGRRTIGR
ncbi:MAG TPA: TIGR04338 family metallohydrolase [Motilibacterales bacterium]|nr:TIGR04338 family metallohydrolase [Motilibacterales bacterium]